MDQPAPPAITGDRPSGGTADPRDRLFKSGLIGAGALTVTWWALIACGLWRAIEWAIA